MNKMRTYILIIILTAYLLAGLAYAFNNESSKFAMRSYKRIDAVPGELVVKFKGVPNVGGSAIMTYSDSSAASILSRAKVKKVRNIGTNDRASVMSRSSNAIDQPGIYTLKFNEKEDLYALTKELLKDSAVEYVEPNHVFQVFVSPNDPSYQFQWGLSKIGAPSAWDIQKGDPSVVIAIIDTGVDYTHQDLMSNIWVNEDEVPGNGIDDDGNGYVDDVRGWDFLDVPSDWLYTGEEGVGEDNDPMDFLGHGTHVAGIAAGVTNNSQGVAGTSWNAKIMPLRVGYMGFDGYGYIELGAALGAIYYAADNGASVINMSWGSLFNSALLADAVNYAHSKGCVMVAAAGNVDGYDAQKPFYPAAYDNVIAVSATDDSDKISIWNFYVFSNFGSFVDICAPGTNVISCIPGDAYSYENGTSMATPYVAGAAALLKSRNPSWTPEQIEERLKESADDIYAVNKSFLAGKLGAGRLNINKALGNLRMAIIYPRQNNILSNLTVIKGSANVENFKEYRIECSPSSDPESWVPVGDVHDKPVENDVLDVWKVGDPNSQYYLKLTVLNTSNESFSTITGVNFGVNGEVKLSGTPKSGPNPYDPSAGQYLFYYDLMSTSTVYIYVYDLSGNLIWQRSVQSSIGPNRVYWDGINGFGSQIGNGAYLYMIVANDEGTRKIIGRGKIAVVKS